jgi:hypothetical protein
MENLARFPSVYIIVFVYTFGKKKRKIFKKLKINQYKTLSNDSLHYNIRDLKRRLYYAKVYM